MFHFIIVPFYLLCCEVDTLFDCSSILYCAQPERIVEIFPFKRTKIRLIYLVAITTFSSYLSLSVCLSVYCTTRVSFSAVGEGSK